jgi:hypothetical protein
MKMSLVIAVCYFLKFFSIAKVCDFYPMKLSQNYLSMQWCEVGNVSGMCMYEKKYKLSKYLTVGWYLAVIGHR